MHDTWTDKTTVCGDLTLFISHHSVAWTKKMINQESKFIYLAHRKTCAIFEAWILYFTVNDAYWVKFLISNHCCCWVTLIASAKLLRPMRSGCNPHQLMNYHGGFQVQSKPRPNAPTNHEHTPQDLNRTEMISCCSGWWKKEEKTREENISWAIPSWFIASKSGFDPLLQQEDLVSTELFSYWAADIIDVSWWNLMLNTQTISQINKFLLLLSIIQIPDN